MESSHDIGMIGLGTMGRNLVLNMADHGFAAAGYDRDRAKADLLEREASGRSVLAAKSQQELVDALRKPRTIMMLVPAGKTVDAVIRDVLPYLEPGDLIIDGGNSHYKDTDIRTKSLADKGLHFLGVGISGGEKGARFGPSIMPGGERKAYERVKPIFEAVAAKVDGSPCVAYLGAGSAGHYVKMIHNGIEYALMQLISETYHMLTSILGLKNEDLAGIYEDWNRGELQSFLIEITADIFLRLDERTGLPLIDKILDAARQKGTGKWTSQDAMDLQIPVPTIDMAVTMRDLSTFKEQRQALAEIFTRRPPSFVGEKNVFIGTLRSAFYVAMITIYAQGMALLKAASDTYRYEVPLGEVVGIWRGGCIIRAKLLEIIRSIFQTSPHLPNLMLDKTLARIIMDRQEELRRAIQQGLFSGIPIPGFMASLAYIDAFRSSWLPANLIQAQRDYFGSHTYERIDEKGVFHTEWQPD